MKRPGAPWFSLLVIGSTLEAWALRKRDQRYEHTASQFIRRSFRTHHPIGKAVFVASWFGLTYWLVPHITDRENDCGSRP